MSCCCFFILSTVVLVQSHVIRNPPSVPALFLSSYGESSSSSSSSSSAECREASAIRDTLAQASLNFQDCDGETANHECVGATLEAIAECNKNYTIDSECVQNTYDSLGDDAHRTCFCGGWNKLESMAVTVEAIMCVKEKPSRQEKGYGWGENYKLFQDFLKNLREKSLGNYRWDFSGIGRPETWYKKYPDCAGKSQSPINIVYKTPQPETSPLLLKRYQKLKKMKLYNNGHGVQIDFQDVGDNGLLKGNHLEHVYQLVQLHWHWGKNDDVGSEHELSGQPHPLEAHFVHGIKGMSVGDALNTPKGLSVIGIFYEIRDEDNPVLEPIINQLKNLINKGDNVIFDTDVSDWKVSDMLDQGFPSGTEYATYSGSLTTPGCQEVVEWNVVTKPVGISKRQLDKFRTIKDSVGKLLRENGRPIQKLNGRKVSYWQRS